MFKKHFLLDEVTEKQGAIKGVPFNEMKRNKKKKLWYFDKDL